MANPEHLEWLREGVESWNNRWMELRADGGGAADLSGADLRGADLSGADLREANLSEVDLRAGRLHGATLVMASLTGAHLQGANLTGADLSEAKLVDAHLGAAILTGAILRTANLSRADLRYADLSGADLSGATFGPASYLDPSYLRNAQLPAEDVSQVMRASATGFNEFIGADLSWANLAGATLVEANLIGTLLTETNLAGAKLRGALLQRAVLVHTDLRGADLTGCRVYGISAWDLQVDEQTTQANLVITPYDQPEVSVDNLKVAQFVYLLLTNPEVRDVIDTIGRKAVLILGRFTDERKAVLEALREALRQHDYVPILFDFDRPASRDLTETISTLAHLARFVVADLTDAKSLPQELSAIVPFLPSVPIQPLILAGQHEYAMFEHWQRYPWVLPVYRYGDHVALLAALEEHVVAPAEATAKELAPPPRDVG